MRKLKQITIELSDVCLQQCIFCSSKKDTKNSLSLSEVKNIIDEASKLNVETIAFSGGEPLIYKNIDKCIEYSKSKSIYTVLYTGGIISKYSPIQEEDIYKQKISIVDQVYLSIHGFDEDSTTGIKGSYNLKIQSLENLLKNNIQTGIHCVVSDNNIEQLLLFCKEMINIGVCNIKPMKLIKQGRAIDNYDSLISNNYEKITEEIYRIFKIYENRISIGCFWGGKNSILSKKNIDFPRCKLGKSVLTIMSTGEVVPCGANKMNQVGNIREQSLYHIWEAMESRYDLNNYRCYNIF